MQCLQDLNHTNIDNLNNVKCEASGHIRIKKKEYLETNSNIKNIRNLYRTIIDLKKGYHPKTNIVKDEKVDLVTDSYSILARWKNHRY